MHMCLQPLKASLSVAKPGYDSVVDGMRHGPVYACEITSSWLAWLSIDKSKKALARMVMHKLVDCLKP